jgi:hypothetical protein
MKNIISVLLTFIITLAFGEGQSQTYLISQGGSVTTCSGDFYDSGGPSGNYGNDEEFTMTFYPATSGAKLQFNFTAFNVVSNPPCNQDFFRIYDGINTGAPVIGTYCQTNSPGLVTATNSTGALTFYFKSNRNNNSSGWTATISCNIPPNLGFWTGLTSTDWNTASNWLNNLVPTSAVNVTIPSSAPNWPVYTGNLTLGSACTSIAMDGNSELTITGNLIIPQESTFVSTGSSYIRIGGDLSRTGLFDAGTGTVEFYGSSQNAIDGPSATNYLIDENFSTFPGNWSGDVSGSPAADNFYQVSSANAGGSSPEVRYQRRNPGNSVTRRMVHTPVNTSGAKSLTFEFKHSVDYGSGTYTIKAEYSTDGTNWQDAGWSLTPTGNIPATAVSIPLTVAQGVGSPTYYISFTLVGVLKNVDYWYIDDVRLSYSASGNPITFHNLVINKSNAEVVADGDIEVANQFTIRPGAYFTNSTGKILDVGGNAVFEADATGMASFIDNGTTNIAGAITVQQYLTSEKWHLVGAPISDAVISSYFDTYLKFYNEPSDSWTYLVLPLTTPMNVAGGYAAWASNSLTGTTTIEFETATGSLNNADYYIDTLSFTSGAPMEGFNLLGNPYTSALDWNTNWSMNNLSGWMVIYDNGIYRGYHTDGSAYNGGTSIIPSTQGFWVRALGSNANITIPRAERVHNAQPFYKSENLSIYPEIRLTSEINGMMDETAILFSPGATAGFDGFYDLMKFENVSEAPTLYTISGGKEYGVNYLSENYNDVTIPVGFKTGQDGIYVIKAPKVGGFPSNIKVYLEDRKTGTISDLFENSMSEFAYSVSDDPHRFNILLKDMAMGFEDISTQDVFIYSFQNTVNIKIPQMQHGEASVYDLLGREIIRKNIRGENLNQIEVNSIPGYYIVRVRTVDQVVTQKVFIR